MRRPTKRTVYIGLILAAVAAGLGIVLAQSGTDPGASATDDVVEIVDGRAIRVDASGRRYVVDPALIVGGGPPKDGIPSIDRPRFVSVAEADAWITDDELVLALVYEDVVRVYPLQILVWHEIVNDTIAGDPILITYCPLCGSGIAYRRTLDGEAVEFGTSGKLYNSNLVMYDRKTDTYWSQIDGLAIVGELAGRTLEAISIDTVVWRDWRLAYPDSEVLSQETGFFRRYGVDPYGSYYEDSFLIFPVEERDDRVHPKTVVFGIEVDGAFVAYRESDLIALGTIEDVVGGVRVRVTRDPAGVVSVVNLDTGAAIVKERDFWFAWYAFHPETHLFQPATSDED